MPISSTLSSVPLTVEATERVRTAVNQSCARDVGKPQHRENLSKPDPFNLESKENNSLVLDKLLQHGKGKHQLLF